MYKTKNFLVFLHRDSVIAIKQGVNVSEVTRQCIYCSQPDSVIDGTEKQVVFSRFYSSTACARWIIC